MSSIRITQLSAIGSDLFEDSESFLQELRSDEIQTVAGGVVISQVTAGQGFVYFPGRARAALRAGDIEALQALGKKFKAWFDFLNHHPAFLTVRWHLPH